MFSIKIDDENSNDREVLVALTSHDVGATYEQAHEALVQWAELMGYPAFGFTVDEDMYRTGVGLTAARHGMASRFIGGLTKTQSPTEKSQSPTGKWPTKITKDEADMVRDAAHYLYRICELMNDSREWDERTLWEVANLVEQAGFPHPLMEDQGEHWVESNGRWSQINAALRKVEAGFTE